jgi:hypothetical protein
MGRSSRASWSTLILDLAYLLRNVATVRGRAVGAPHCLSEGKQLLLPSAMAREHDVDAAAVLEN